MGGDTAAPQTNRTESSRPPPIVSIRGSGLGRRLARAPAGPCRWLAPRGSVPVTPLAVVGWCTTPPCSKMRADPSGVRRITPPRLVAEADRLASRWLAPRGSVPANSRCRRAAPLAAESSIAVCPRREKMKGGRISRHEEVCRCKPFGLLAIIVRPSARRPRPGQLAARSLTHARRANRLPRPSSATDAESLCASDGRLGPSRAPQPA